MPGKTKTAGGSARVGLLDELRGFAIICMVVYHAMYDLKYIFGLDVPVFFEDWFGIIRDVFAGLFIFISGTVCRYSKNNMKRGIQCFFIGMVMTFVMPFFTGGTIMFGILHCLGICMMIFGLGEHVFDALPALVGIIICALLFVLTWNIRDGYIGFEGVFSLALPAKAYDVGVLFPLGLPSASFYSADYFPLMPWFFLFIAGIAGASVSKMEEMNEGMVMFTMLVIVGAYMSLALSMSNVFAENGQLSGTFAMVCCLLPISSIFTVPANLMMGSVSAVTGLLSILILVAGNVLMLVITSKIYEYLLFYNGVTLKIRDIIHIIRYGRVKEAK